MKKISMKGWALLAAVASIPLIAWAAAGKYVRIRYGSVTGTATATINTEQQEVLI